MTQSLIVQLREGTYRGLRRVQARVRGDFSIPQIIRIACQELVKTSDQLERQAKRNTRNAERKGKPLSRDDATALIDGIQIFRQYRSTIVQPIVIGPPTLRISMEHGSLLESLGWTVADDTGCWTYRPGAAK